jgi:hypothetical protein
MIINNLKAMSATDDELVVANYIVLFGGRDLEWVKRGPNPDGSKGEFFTEDTVLESSYTKSGHLYVDWEHGYGPDLDGPEAPVKDDVLGFVDWKTARKDKRGWWVERVLSRRNQYVKWLEELIQAGLLGTSSEPIQKGVVKGKDGKIAVWPLKRDTLTAQPAEPRMMTENVVVALKNLTGKLSIPGEMEVVGHQQTIAETAEYLGKALNELIDDTRGLLDSVDGPLSQKKRDELGKLLTLCDGMDDVRTSLKSVLFIPAGIVEARRLQFEMAQKRQRLASILGE